MKHDSTTAAAASGRETPIVGQCPPFCGLGAAKEVAERLAPGGMVLREQRAEGKVTRLAALE